MVVLSFWNAASCASFHWKVALDLVSSLNGWGNGAIIWDVSRTVVR